MKLGMSCGTDSIRIAAENGARGAPLAINVLAQKGPKEAVAPLAAAGLEVCQIMAFAFNALSADTARQAEQRALVEKAIPMAPDTGCRVIVVNGGNYDPSGFLRGHRDNFTAAALDEAARGLEPICRLAEKHGAQIAIEPFIQCVVNTPERYLRIKEKIASPALTVNLDLCNFFTFDDMWRPSEASARICAALAGHYSLVHCKDLAVSKGVHIHIDETPLGTGVADWTTALQFIARDLPADGWFIYEHIKAPEHAPAGMRYLLEAAAKAGVSFS
ncbi:MAG: Xylose isomerase-like TIM barrel [candidate division BRC1 bacterium ADurb.BinA364]|nr:MAG: Xylose isomerase-like TIM barrel [candidate division BRC1 bacterium ADurb.BinA364]